MSTRLLIIGGLLTGCAAAPVCSDPVVSFDTADTMKAVHWNTAAGCIPTTFDSTYITQSDYRGLVQSAFDAWSNISDVPLCFDALKDSTTEPSDRSDHRFHIEGGPAGGEPAVTTTVSDAQTGEIVYAIMTVEILNPMETPALTTADFIRLVGLGIGLNSAQPGADSVMAKPVLYTAPTGHDVTAVHALYDASCKLY